MNPEHDHDSFTHSCPVCGPSFKPNIMKTKISKLYRFDFDKGIPVIGGAMRWRKGLKTITAYGLQNAVEKFAMPVFRQYGTDCKLNVLKAWSSDDGKQWNELDAQSVHFAAFLTGCLEREKQQNVGRTGHELFSAWSI